jgi:hypothetical protein
MHVKIDHTRQKTRAKCSMYQQATAKSCMP